MKPFGMANKMKKNASNVDDFLMSFFPFFSVLVSTFLHFHFIFRFHQQTSCKLRRIRTSLDDACGLHVSVCMCVKMCVVISWLLMCLLARNRCSNLYIVSLFFFFPLLMGEKKLTVELHLKLHIFLRLGAGGSLVGCDELSFLKCISNQAKKV